MMGMYASKANEETKKSQHKQLSKAMDEFTLVEPPQNDPDKEIETAFNDINPIRHGGGGHFVPGSFSYCDCQNFSIATMSSNFLTFPRNI